MKPKIAFFDFSCCEGCQLQVLNLEEEILDLLGQVEIVQFREAMTEKGEDYQIAFIEGSIQREAGIERVKKIREKADVLVALGACACIAGVNGIRNTMDFKDVGETVYGADMKYFPDVLPKALAIDQVVKVDYYIPGCPINKYEFVSTVKALLSGVEPKLPDYPVCVECKLKGNVCLFDKGKFCMGPIIRAGCDAWCPTHNEGCAGCRGYVPDPNINSAKDVLERYGLTVEDIKKEFTHYLAAQETSS